MSNTFSNISPKAKIGKGVKIQSFVTIGDDVEIGDNCWIGSNVNIMDGARIGKILQKRDTLVLNLHEDKLVNAVFYWRHRCEVFFKPFFVLKAYRYHHACGA